MIPLPSRTFSVPRLALVANENSQERQRVGVPPFRPSNYTLELHRMIDRDSQRVVAQDGIP
jgi:hypothetical protein